MTTIMLLDVATSLGALWVRCVIRYLVELVQSGLDEMSTRQRWDSKAEMALTLPLLFPSLVMYRGK